MRRALLSVLYSLASLAQSGGQLINVLIQNPSFEQTPVRPFNQNPCGPWIWEVPGWTVTGLSPGWGAGVFQPAIPSPVDNPNCLGGESPAPDGKTVAYISGASISQNLGTAFPNGVYVLKASFADRFYYYAGDFSVSLTYGTQTLCSTSGLARGDFVEIPLVCPVQKNPTPEPLVLTITNTGPRPVFVDNVSLTFTPQP